MTRPMFVMKATALAVLLMTGAAAAGATEPSGPVRDTAAGVAGATADTNTKLPMTDGEIRKIDLATQKITLRHGAIVNLGMPPMTMAYRVKNPAWLSTLQAGQRIRFAVDRVDGNFTIVALEVVP